MFKKLGVLFFCIVVLALAVFAPVTILMAADNSAPAIAWQPLLTNILLAVLIPIATFIGGLAAWAINLGISKIKNSMAQQLAMQAVLWAEQKFKGLKGSERYEKAVDWLASKLPGVKHEDLDRFIEAAVGAMNSQVKIPKASAS